MGQQQLVGGLKVDGFKYVLFSILSGMIIPSEFFTYKTDIIYYIIHWCCIPIFDVMGIETTWEALVRIQSHLIYLECPLVIWHWVNHPLQSVNYNVDHLFLKGPFSSIFP